ncbi:MAG: ATP-binding protein [Geminicoccaceae bacterium]
MRRRLVGGLACLLALSVLINFAVLALLVLPGFSEIERQQAEQSLARVQDALRHDLDHVGSLANDYAVWDATWSYIQKPNDAYLYENYSAVPLENLGVDIVVLLDATGKVVHAGMLKDDEITPPPQKLVEDLTALRRHFQADGVPEAAEQTIIDSAVGPLLVGMRSILHTDGSGPAAGTEIFAKRLGQEEFKEIAGRVHESLAVHLPDGDLPADFAEAAPLLADPKAGPMVVTLDDDRMAAYGVVRDIEGDPQIIMRVDTPRDVSEIAWRTLALASLGFAAATAIVLAACWFGVRKVLFDPLVKLTRRISAMQRSGDLSSALALDRTDELGVLAGELDRMRQDLAAARERLQQLLAGSPVVIYRREAGKDGKISFVSENARRVFGMEPEALTGDPNAWMEHVVEADRERLVASRSAARIGTLSVTEYRIHDHAGRERWVQDELRAVTDERWRIVAYVGSWTEITQLKAAQAKLEHQAKAMEDLAHKAEQANRAKSAFLATMSHEIRTPLNGVLGALGLLSETEKRTEESRLLDTARHSAEALLLIINDILDFSRIEAGKLSLELGPVAILPMAQAVVDLCAVQAKAKHLRLTLEVAPTMPRHVVGDAGRLRQMLLNFVTNAIKFTDEGEVRVSIAPAAVEGTYRFAVTDTGIGIPPERQGDLFRDFSQLRGPGRHHIGGTGLGLAITKRLASVMGGSVGVESSAGRGSKFWFDVPLGAAAATSLPDRRGNVALAPVLVQGRAPRLLVADDNTANLLLARAMLERLGCRVDTVSDGAAAMHAVKEQPYDAVLMDVSMPVLDGVEATRRLREEGFALPIVAVTANAAPEDHRLYRSQGMTDCLVKPYDRATLRTVLVRHLGDEGEESATTLRTG